MSTPNEQATDGSPADPAVAGPPAAPASEEDTGDAPAAEAGSADPGPAQPPPPRSGGPNGWATSALVSGILGVTGIGVLLGICFGVFGLAGARRGRGGAVRSWVGIIAALLWAAAIIYVTPHVIKAADPGCTSFKETALSHYNKAVEDFGSSNNSAKTEADLSSAIAYLRAAAAKSKNAESRKALSNLAAQLTTAREDENSGRIPGSAILALNRDASLADSACGTF